jgi:hypothetical protein
MKRAAAGIAKEVWRTRPQRGHRGERQTRPPVARAPRTSVRRRRPQRGHRGERQTRPLVIWATSSALSLVRRMRATS